jgi:hypothetical protein
MKARFALVRCAGVIGALAFALVFAAAQTSLTESRPLDPAPSDQGPDAAAPEFRWVDVYIDSGNVPLAAYQFELAAETGDFRIVGIEGGEHPAFAEPPYYDPAALQNDRVILAAFSTADELPTGNTRVARVHVMIEGNPPQYLVTLSVAATKDGSRIPVDIVIEEGAQP